MERHGRDLEDEAREHEDDAEEEADRTRPGGKRCGDLVEADAAGVAIDERDAVEQQSEERELSTKYLRPDSVERRLSRWKAAST
jgi:hypothetical protein